jgi:cell division septal protein FtsQ
MMRRSSESKPRNQRISSPKQRRQRHLLDVKVRSRKASEQRNQRLVLWGCRLVVIAAVIGGLVLGGRAALRKFLWQNQEFQISEIKVNTDGSLSREEILKAAGIHTGENIFAVKLGVAHERLAHLPQVEHVEIQRGLPNRISIDVAERHPVAWIASGPASEAVTGSEGLLVDAQGTVMKAGRVLPDYLRLPLICGVNTANLADGQTVDLPELRAALELLQLNGDNARLQIRSIDLEKGYCLLVTDNSQAVYTFSPDRISDQLDRLNRVFDYAESNQQQLQTVNLLVQRNVPVTFMQPEVADAADEAGQPKKSAPAKAGAGAQKTSTSAVEEKPSSKQNTQHTKARSKTASRDQSEHPVKRAESVKVRRAIPVRRAQPVDSQSSSNDHG